MTRDLIFSMPSASRDDFRIWGFRFGKAGARKALAVVAGLRGDEIQQLHAASLLVRYLGEHETLLAPDVEVLVIPSANPWSFNVAERFWGLDGTDLNRMFPGLDAGETTQRVASAIFQTVKDYEFGINLTSINQPGAYVPHVRINRSGFEDLSVGLTLGLPYLHLHETSAQETSSLNYNWQIWSTKALSLIGGKSFELDSGISERMSEGVLRLMRTFKILARDGSDALAPAGGNGSSAESGPAEENAAETRVLRDADITTVKVGYAGLFVPEPRLGDAVGVGALLGRVFDPLSGEQIEELRAPRGGTVFYRSPGPLVYQRMVAYRLV